MSLTSFQPQGNTVLVAATTAPSAAQQISTASIVGYRLLTQGTPVVFLSFGSSSVQASLPTTAAAGSMPLLPNAVEKFNLAPNTWVSAITTSGAASLYGTPGFGI